MDLQIEKGRATLRGLVEDKIRETISTGVFAPGQRLIERELCETMGVGRTSVREALRQLEAEGLIETVPHRGPSVVRMSAQDAAQLYALRALLEGHTGAECARRADGTTVARLQAAADTFVDACAVGERGAMVAAKAAFYDVMMEGCANRYVAKALTGLHNQISALRFTSMSQPARVPRSIAEIREIVAAIRAGDPARAEAACRHHIENAAEVALALIED